MLYGVLYSTKDVPASEQIQHVIAENKFPCTLDKFEFTDSELVFEGSLVGMPAKMICVHSAKSDTEFDLFDVDFFGEPFDRCFGAFEPCPYNEGLSIYFSYVSSAFCEVSNALFWQSDCNSPNSLGHESIGRQHQLIDYLVSLYFYEISRFGEIKNSQLHEICTNSWLNKMSGKFGDMYKDRFLKLRDGGNPVYEDGICLVHKMYEITDQGKQQVQSMLNRMKQSA